MLRGNCLLSLSLRSVGVAEGPAFDSVSTLTLSHLTGGAHSPPLKDVLPTPGYCGLCFHGHKFSHSIPGSKLLGQTAALRLSKRNQTVLCSGD